MSITLIDEQYSWKTQTLEEFINEGNIPIGWEDYFNDFSNREKINDISSKLKEQSKENIIYPPINYVFRALIRLPKIKVVILGQDPYHNGSAVGLCFSVKKGNAINPSLRNIYKELELEQYNVNKDGDLSHLYNQGCLLLNLSLTVNKGEPDSHTRIWSSFTYTIIKYISDNTSNIIWLLMGNNAQSSLKHIDTNKHVIFKTSHPSPFSAYNSYRDVPAFIGSNIFKKINNNLSLQNKNEIKW